MPPPPKKIFLTGATGFIGQHLTRLLLQQGHEVTALLRTESKKNLLPPNVQFIKGDLSIFENPELQLPPFDIVIHLAGVVFAKTDAKYMHYNCTAVKHLVACLQRQNWPQPLQRFLFASSLAAAGPSGKTGVLTETQTPSPIEPYGKAKLAAEHFLDTINTFPISSFRPAIVLGVGDTNSLTLFKMAKSRLGISVNGKPQYLTFIDIDDLNQAILKMMLDEDTSVQHKKYFVAHPSRISNIELFNTLGKVMNRKVLMIPLPSPLLYASVHVATAFTSLLGIRNQLDKKQYLQLTNHFVCSSNALSKDLNWQAQNDLTATITKAYKGYRAMGWL